MPGPLPQGREAVYGRSTTPHCPQAMRQCEAGFPLPTAPRRRGSALHCPLPSAHSNIAAGHTQCGVVHSTKQCGTTQKALMVERGTQGGPRAMGGGPVDPLYAAGPPGVRGAQRAGHRVYPQRCGGVHQGLVCSREGARHTAKGPLGPGQHNGVGVAGAAPAPASGKRGGAAGAPGITMAATAVPARSFQPPPVSAQEPHTYTQRAHNTHSPARLPLPLGRHPGLLPFGNSAFGTPHHTRPHRTAPHRTAPHRTAPHRTAPHHTTPHHTTPHHTLSTPQLYPRAGCRVRSPGRQGPGTASRRCTNSVGCAHVPVPSAIPRDPAAPSTGRLGPGNGQRPPIEDG